MNSLSMSFAMQHLMNLHADSESDTDSDDDSSESDDDNIPRLFSRVEEGYDDDDDDETAAGDNMNGIPRLLTWEEESDSNEDDDEIAAFADIQVFTAAKLLLEGLPTRCWIHGEATCKGQDDNKHWMVFGHDERWIAE
jgi:hypothetical protein